MMTQQGWQELQILSGDALKSRVFHIMRDLAGAIQDREIDDPDVTGSVPRLAKLISERKELSSYREIFSTLARSTGLWNYIDTDTADVRDEIIAESVTVPALGGVTLHREQVAALNTLLSGPECAYELREKLAYRRAYRFWQIRAACNRPSDNCPTGRIQAPAYH